MKMEGVFFCSWSCSKKRSMSGIDSLNRCSTQHAVNGFLA